MNDEDTRGGILGDFTLGLNGYVDSHVRFMFNYIHSTLNGQGRGDIVSLRFQIDY